MWRLRLRILLVILSFTTIEAEDPELPLCPTNMQYFPQNLPMHCRLPGTVPPFPSLGYQNPLPDKQPIPMPVPLPGMPGPIPGPMPGPMPMPMVPMPPSPAHKLPVIVMPFYSPDTSGKKPHTSHQDRPPRKRRLPVRKRKPKYYSSDEDSTNTDSSTDTDYSTDTSSERGFWRGPRTGRRSNRHHKSKRKKHQQQQNKEILTPILQYVTKDGYVIFEKQISKGEAKDWLGSKSEHNNLKEVTTVKNENDFEYEPREPRSNDKLMKNLDEIEVQTELNPHQVHKKKNLKRKPNKKTT
ncbi:SR-related and CTD-associated factor 4-like [Maniola jurtina]|uniref:SR-related and CTD-associated factor 4-like n=1 Tax=Maniola jurtina TaxID=191418 RepID=UPI001E68E66B|nr:SR-related and CTD-associated factor 4-like [Maniola jurtina]